MIWTIPLIFLAIGALARLNIWYRSLPPDQRRDDHIPGDW